MFSPEIETDKLSEYVNGTTFLEFEDIYGNLPIPNRLDRQTNTLYLLNIALDSNIAKPKFDVSYFQLLSNGKENENMEKWFKTYTYLVKAITR